MANQIDQPISDVAGGIAAALAGIGILLMVLFPFALPALLLAAVLAAPLVLPVAVLAIAAALVAGPFLAIRRIVSRASGLHGRRVTSGRARGSSLPCH